jgi:Spy/CpxP family protein refolding chaperone
MKTKTFVLAVVGLGLTTVLMAGNPQGGWDNPRGDQGRHGMYQKGDRQSGMHRRGDRDGQKMCRGQRRGANKGFMRQMARQLDLTSDQRQKIRDIFNEERKAKKAERKAHRGERKKRGGVFGDLNPETFMSADHFDKKAFTKAVQKQADDRKAERAAKRKSRVEQRAAFMEKIFNILTPEQRVKWIELAK